VSKRSNRLSGCDVYECKRQRCEGHAAAGGSSSSTSEQQEDCCTSSELSCQQDAGQQEEQEQAVSQSQENIEKQQQEEDDEDVVLGASRWVSAAHARQPEYVYHGMVSSNIIVRIQFQTWDRTMMMLWLNQEVWKLSCPYAVQ
jgi:hypothetical protein